MNLLLRLMRNDRGATAMIFGLALVPLVLLAGAAVDYSRSTDAKTQLQRALDMTALTLASRSRDLDDSQLVNVGQEIFRDVIARRADVEFGAIEVARSEDEVVVRGSAVVRNAFMSVAGLHTTTIGAVSAASDGGDKKIELALVLDNTGSMAWLNRMDELQIASNNLLSTLNRATPDDDTIRVSIVPFDVGVRVNPGAYRYADWVRFDSENDRHNWRGYIIDRDLPYYTGAEPAVPADPETLYPARPGNPGLAPIIPLTSVRSGYADLRAAVSAMRPNGCTNITVGAAWGNAVLRSDGPLPGARPPGEEGVEKIMILLTDGDNTRSRYVAGASCSIAAGRPIDPSTLSACESAKRDGVTVYTVRLIEGNAAMLRNCASTGANGQPLYFDVRDASQLNGVFQSIAQLILSTRFTQ
ncbi:MAG: VWA domain-containing protein [Salinarimonadaceae bacterium]|nr:MAG: VWA domain-containing protein [Salinarimonadaceae bacterium]